MKKIKDIIKVTKFYDLSKNIEYKDTDDLVMYSCLNYLLEKYNITEIYDNYENDIKDIVSKSYDLNYDEYEKDENGCPHYKPKYIVAKDLTDGLDRLSKTILEMQSLGVNSNKEFIIDYAISNYNFSEKVLYAFNRLHTVHGLKIFSYDFFKYIEHKDIENPEDFDIYVDNLAKIFINKKLKGHSTNTIKKTINSIESDFILRNLYNTISSGNIKEQVKKFYITFNGDLELIWSVKHKNKVLIKNEFFQEFPYDNELKQYDFEKDIFNLSVKEVNHILLKKCRKRLLLNSAPIIVRCHCKNSIGKVLKAKFYNYTNDNGINRSIEDVDKRLDEIINQILENKNSVYEDFIVYFEPLMNEIKQKLDEIKNSFNKE